jgi:hypothetical protein
LLSQFLATANDHRCRSGELRLIVGGLENDTLTGGASADRVANEGWIEDRHAAK